MLKIWELMYRIREWNTAYKQEYCPGWIYIYSTKWWIKAQIMCLWYNYKFSLKYEVNKCEY